MIVRLSEVKAGMQLQRSGYGKDYLLLLAKGTILTNVHVERLIRNQGKLFHNYIFIEEGTTYESANIVVSL